MSDTNQAMDAPPEKPRQKRKYIRRAKTVARPTSTISKMEIVAPEKKLDPFAGMTPVLCPDACYAQRGKCPSISRGDYCAHPCKGGLQTKSMRDPEACHRFAEAKAYLEHQKVEKKKK